MAEDRRTKTVPLNPGVPLNRDQIEDSDDRAPIHDPEVGEPPEDDEREDRE